MGKGKMCIFPKIIICKRLKKNIFPERIFAEKNYFPDSKMWERVKRKKKNNFWTVIVQKY
jgi:hypothetical protein